MNVKWLGDILLGNFEALQQTQYGCSTTFGLQDPFAPTPHLVVNLLGKQANSLWPWAGAPTLLLASGSRRFLSHLLFPLHAASHCTEPRSFVGLYFCLLFLWTLRSGRNTRKPFDLVFQASSHLTSSVRNGTPCPHFVLHRSRGRPTALTVHQMALTLFTHLSVTPGSGRSNAALTCTPMKEPVQFWS